MRDEMLKIEIQKEALRIKNLQEHAEEVKKKLFNLQVELEHLDSGINQAFKNISRLGQNHLLFTGEGPQLDETRLRKELEIYKKKVLLFKQFFPQEAESLETLIPKTLKDLEN